MFLDYLRLALRNLARRRLRSWLTMIGIIIGITAVVSLVGLGEGLRVAIASQFGDLGTDKLTIQASSGFGPPGTAAVKPLTKSNLERIDRVNGVQVTAGRIIEAGRLRFNDEVQFGYAVSMPDGDSRKLVEDAMGFEAESGRLLEDGDSGDILIGGGVAEIDFDGENIRVGSRVLVQEEEYEVIGILKKMGSIIMDNAIYINEDDMRETLSVEEDTYDIIVAQVNEGADMTAVKERIERLLRKERDVDEGEEDFTVETPQQILGQVNSTLLAVQIFVYVIAGISILVGGIGIMNTMFTSVMERTREIGIMKSIGARNGTVFTLFFIESGFLGMVGGILGAILGITIAKGLAYLGRNFMAGELIRAEISIWLVVGSILGSFLLGSVFGMIPAYNASKLNPVDALRKS